MENGIALNLIFYIMLLHFLHLLLASFVFPSSSFTACSARVVLEPGQAGGAAMSPQGSQSRPHISPIPCKGGGCSGCPFASALCRITTLPPFPARKPNSPFMKKVVSKFAAGQAASHVLGTEARGRRGVNSHHAGKFTFCSDLEERRTGYNCSPT